MGVAVGNLRRLLWKPGKLSVLVIIACGLLVTGALWFSMDRSQARLEFMVQSTVPGRLQVFFGEGDGFSEAMSEWYDVAVGPRQSVSLVQAASRLAKIRIDPPSGGNVSLCDIKLSVAGVDYGYVTGATHDAELAEAGPCLMLSSVDSADPQLLLAGSPALGAALSTAGQWGRFHEGAVYAGLACLLLLLIDICRLFFVPLRRLARLAWMERVDDKAHWICVALLLSFGSCYALRTPPGAVPDEATHLAKIVQIGEGAPFGGNDGQRFPDLSAMYGPFSVYLGNRQPFTRMQLSQQLARPLVCEPTKVMRAGGADPYFPHHYAVAAVAFRATCAVRGSFGTFLYSARLLNLLLATLLIGLGVALAGRAKWALVSIVLLPMSMSQLASLSADSLVIALSIAWIGLTSGLAAGRVQARRALPLLWMMAIAIGLLKPGAAWVLASLVFCRDAFRQSGLSFVRGLGCFLALPWMLHLILIGMAESSGVAREGVDPAMNIRLLLQEPSIFLGLLWNTLGGENGAHLYRMMVGILGWIDVPLSKWAYVLAGYALVAALFLAGNRPDSLQWRRVAPVALMMAAGSVMLIALPLYVQWTSLDAVIVQGLQGRYFLPTLAFAWAWMSMRSPDPIRAALLMFVLAVAVVLNLDALDRLHQAYFVVGR